ncbi:hypothetical protein MW887_011653 [Aspergillus wentii]|nr:hypothetical protein MW887_011653 [Aspergillus wentii]
MPPYSSIEDPFDYTTPDMPGKHHRRKVRGPNNHDPVDHEERAEFYRQEWAEQNEENRRYQYQALQSDRRYEHQEAMMKDLADDNDRLQMELEEIRETKKKDDERMRRMEKQAKDDDVDIGNLLNENEDLKEQNERLSKRLVLGLEKQRGLEEEVAARGIMMGEFQDNQDKTNPELERLRNEVSFYHEERKQLGYDVQQYVQNLEDENEVLRQQVARASGLIAKISSQSWRGYSQASALQHVRAQMQSQRSQSLISDEEMEDVSDSQSHHGQYPGLPTANYAHQMDLCSRSPSLVPESSRFQGSYHDSIVSQTRPYIQYQHQLTDANAHLYRPGVVVTGPHQSPSVGSNEEYTDQSGSDSGLDVTQSTRPPSQSTDPTESETVYEDRSERSGSGESEQTEETSDTSYSSGSEDEIEYIPQEARIISDTESIASSVLSIMDLDRTQPSNPSLSMSSHSTGDTRSEQKLPSRKRRRYAISDDEDDLSEEDQEVIATQRDAKVCKFCGMSDKGSPKSLTTRFEGLSISDDKCAPQPKEPLSEQPDQNIEVIDDIKETPPASKAVQTEEQPVISPPTKSEHPRVNSLETQIEGNIDMKPNKVQESNPLEISKGVEAEPPMKLSTVPPTSDDPVYLPKPYTMKPRWSFRSPPLFMGKQDIIKPKRSDYHGAGTSIFTAETGALLPTTSPSHVEQSGRSNACHGHGEYRSVEMQIGGQSGRLMQQSYQFSGQEWWRIVILVGLCIYLWYTKKDHRQWMEHNEVPPYTMLHLERGQGPDIRFLKSLAYDVEKLVFDRTTLG